VSLFPQAEVAPSSVRFNPYVIRSDRHSAGGAWFLSLLMPGVGQIYVGATMRGIFTTLFFLAATAGAFFGEGNWRWVAVRMMVVLYAFGGLDAYYTAREYNAGIDPDASANPRLAAVLNMTTNGFGYLYLGVKKGLLIFLAVLLFTRVAGTVLPLLVEIVALGLGIHAWQMAARRREESYPRDMRPVIAETSVPPFLPIGVTSCCLGVYYALVTFGQITLLMR
jgi:TM2 domain-containing membrane protein YozV